MRGPDRAGPRRAARRRRRPTSTTAHRGPRCVYDPARRRRRRLARPAGRRPRVPVPDGRRRADARRRRAARSSAGGSSLAAVARPSRVLAISMVPALQFDGWQWVAFALATPVMLWAGWPFHRATLVNLRHGAATMDTLVSLGTLAAWTWSVVALVFLGAARHGMAMAAPTAPRLLRDRGRDRHAACCSGKYFEARPAALAATRCARCSSSGAKTAGSRTATRSRSTSCAVGDRFVVRPGREDRDRRRRRRRASAVDVSMLTGEPVPVEVGPGDEVFGATREHVDGRLVVEATRVGERHRPGADRAAGRARRRAPRRRCSAWPTASRRVFVPVVLVIAVAHARRLARSPATPPTTRSPPRSRC